MALPPEITQAIVKKRTPRPAVSTAPKDTKSDNEIGRTNKYKKTNEYKSAVREGYTSGSPRQRRAAVTRAEHVFKPSLEQSVVLHEHRSRVARNQELASARTQHDVTTNVDLNTADLETLANHYKTQREIDQKKHDVGLYEQSGLLAASKAAPKAARILFSTDPTALATSGFTKDVVAKAAGTPLKVLANAAKEAVDIPLNAPASAQYTVEHPVETAKAIGHQYSEIYHHPGKTFVEHPLTTVLSVTPAGKLARVAIGRTGAQVALGRTGVEANVAGRGLLGRKEPVTKQMPTREVHKRVDEAMAASYATAANPWKSFATEFSSKTAKAEPRLYGDKSTANIRANTETKLTGEKHVPFEVMTDEGMKHTIVPQRALAQFERHMKMNPGDLTKPEKALSEFGKQFRQVVLSTSPKWLAGNVIEATLRSMVSGSGLVDRHVARQAIKRLEQTDPNAAAQLKARTIAGGHYHMTATGANIGGAIADIPKGVGKIVTGHPIAGAKQMWHGWNHLVFNAVNGRIESQFQTAMMGQALRKNKLISRSTLHLSDKALDEALRGLKNTNTQVRLGRQIDRMYGRYGKFSPLEKRVITNYTPFLRWYMNSVKFLTHVLPADHPVLTSLIANANEASKEWRKSVGQAVDSGTPQYLQGSNVFKGGLLRSARYTPAGVLQSEHGIAESFADTILPQFQTLIHNAKAEDWKGDHLKGDTNYGPFAAMFFSLLEQEVPFGRQAIEATGHRTPNIAESTTITGSVGGRLKKELPWNLTSPKKSQKGGSKITFGQPRGNKNFFGGSQGGSSFFK